MNRNVTTNAVIVIFPMVLLVSYICDSYIPFIGSVKNGYKKGWKRLSAYISIGNVIGLMCMVILTGMTLASVSSVGATIKNKTEYCCMF